MPGALGPPSQDSARLRFQAGGALQEDCFYIERDADRTLLRALEKGEFCQILAPRQIGKSSLRVRTEQRLRAQGVLALSVDLTTIGGGSTITEEQWCYSLCSVIARATATELDPYWDQSSRLTPSARWIGFLRDQVLAPDPRQVVIFIDEIDEVLTLPRAYRDNFFAAVRSLYNNRASAPELERLAICLIGVARPTDLIADPARTPFNIGEAIRLDDLSFEQVQAFLPGLSQQPQPAELLGRVFYWTSGHPAMTQRLCLLLAEEPAAEPILSAADRVDRLVQGAFLSAGGTVPILPEVDRRFSRKNDSENNARMLSLYKLILQSEGQQAPAKRDSEIEAGLRLVGLVAERREGGGTWLAVRNRIFASVFNVKWVDSKELDRAFYTPLVRWERSGKRAEHLLRGRELERADTWLQRQGEDVTAEEREFIAASLRRERQRAQRWLFGILLLGVIAIPVGIGSVREYAQRLNERQESYRKLRAIYARVEELRGDFEASQRYPQLPRRVREQGGRLCSDGDRDLPDAQLRDGDRIALHQNLAHACILSASVPPLAGEPASTAGYLALAIRHARTALSLIDKQAAAASSPEGKEVRDWLVEDRTADRLHYLLAMALSLQGQTEARLARRTEARRELGRVSQAYLADFPPEKTPQLDWALGKEVTP